VIAAAQKSQAQSDEEKMERRNERFSLRSRKRKATVQEIEAVRTYWKHVSASEGALTRLISEATAVGQATASSDRIAETERFVPTTAVFKEGDFVLRVKPPSKVV
jgi:hypothetical protein